MRDGGELGRSTGRGIVAKKPGSLGAGVGQSHVGGQQVELRVKGSIRLDGRASRGRAQRQRENPVAGWEAGVGAGTGGYLARRVGWCWLRR